MAKVRICIFRNVVQVVEREVEVDDKLDQEEREAEASRIGIEMAPKIDFTGNETDVQYEVETI